MKIKMAAMIRTRGTPTAMPTINPRLLPELDVVWPLVELRPVPDEITVLILVTVETEPSFPVVRDLCVTVAVVGECVEAVAGDEELESTLEADFVVPSTAHLVLGIQIRFH